MPWSVRPARSAANCAATSTLRGTGPITRSASASTGAHRPAGVHASTLRIEQRLYHRPRKILGFKTPLEVFSEEVLNSVANQS
jgi:hypothetical protein